MLKHIKKIISYSLIVSLYAAFFVVQIFFNIGSAGYFSNSTENHYSFITQEKESKEISVSTGKSSENSSSKVRLNKRFHPQSMPSLEYTVSELLHTYINEIKIDRPKDYLLISSILADSLRGPPVVA